MTETASYSLREICVASVLALTAEFGFLGLFRAGGPSHVRMDISDDNRRPMSVAIVPIPDDTPVLKLGSPRQPGKLPDRWVAPRPVERAAAAAFPSPHAKPTPEAIPTTKVSDAGARPPSSRDAEVAKQTDLIAQVVDAGGPAPVSTVEGAPDGVKEGTETDPLKAHAVSLYKAKLESWFLSKFHIKGKVPFDTLKGLRASVQVSVGSDRTVSGHVITKPSGDAVFDGEVRAALDSTTGQELPPPPPMYPDVLGTTLPLVFRCTNRSQCE